MLFYAAVDLVSSSRFAEVIMCCVLQYKYKRCKMNGVPLDAVAGWAEGLYTAE